MADQIHRNKFEQVNEIMRTYQGLILDVLEESFGTSPRWQGARSRVLRLLGDNGLSKRVRDIVESGSSSQGGVQ
jgi:hypothetical protein